MPLAPVQSRRSGTHAPGRSAPTEESPASRRLHCDNPHAPVTGPNTAEVTAIVADRSGHLPQADELGRSATTTNRRESPDRPDRRRLHSSIPAERLPNKCPLPPAAKSQSAATTHVAVRPAIVCIVAVRFPAERAHARLSPQTMACLVVRIESL